MAIFLKNPVRRKVFIGRSIYILTLDNDMTITFKKLGKKYKETVSLEACRAMATISTAEARYKAKLAEYQRKKAAGYNRLKKPKKPTIAQMFRPELSAALARTTKINKPA